MAVPGDAEGLKVHGRPTDAPDGAGVMEELNAGGPRRLAVWL